MTGAAAAAEKPIDREVALLVSIASQANSIPEKGFARTATKLRGTVRT